VLIGVKMTMRTGKIFWGLLIFFIALVIVYLVMCPEQFAEFFKSNVIDMPRIIP